MRFCFRRMVIVALVLVSAATGADEHKDYPVALKVIETYAISSKPDGSRITTTCTTNGSGSFTCDSQQVPGAEHVELVSLADPSDGSLYMVACIQGAGRRFAQGFAAGTGAATITGCAVPPGTYKARWEKGRLKVLREKNGQNKEITFIILSSTPARPGKPQASASGSISDQARFSISSVPPGAEIAIDGTFVGQTPSSIPVPPGEHSIRITRAGYEPWERKISTSGGDVTIAAELDVKQK